MDVLLGVGEGESVIDEYDFFVKSDFLAIVDFVFELTPVVEQKHGLHVIQVVVFTHFQKVLDND